MTLFTLPQILQALQQIYGKDALWFPPEIEYQYLRGYTAQRRRAICLIDVVSMSVTKEAVWCAYREVQHAQLFTPFLFFGFSALYQDESCIFRQLSINPQDHSLVLPRLLYRS